MVQFRRSADSSRYLAYLGIASIYYYYRNKDGRFCCTQQHYLLSNLSLSVKLNVIMRLTQSSVIARTDDPFLNLFVTSGFRNIKQLFNKDLTIDIQSVRKEMGRAARNVKTLVINGKTSTKKFHIECKAFVLLRCESRIATDCPVFCRVSQGSLI